MAWRYTVAVPQFIQNKDSEGELVTVSLYPLIRVLQHQRLERRAAGHTELVDDCYVVRSIRPATPVSFCNTVFSSHRATYQNQAIDLACAPLFCLSLCLCASPL